MARTPLRPPYNTRKQEGPAGQSYADVTAGYAEIGRRHPRSTMLLTIMSALATGHLPWGIALHVTPQGPHLSRDEDGRWPLCCGHALGREKAQQLVTAGLLMQSEHPDAKSDDLVITPAGRAWLIHHWHAQPRRGQRKDDSE